MKQEFKNIHPPVKVKDERPLAFIGFLLIIIGVVLVVVGLIISHADAHETGTWKHVEGTGQMDSSKMCPSGALLVRMIDTGRWRGLLLAHDKPRHDFKIHMTEWSIDRPDCELFFEWAVTCNEPTTDAEITFCTGDVNPADPACLTPEDAEALSLAGASNEDIQQMGGVCPEEDEDAYTYSDADRIN
jgi:hypothetical protein